MMRNKPEDERKQIEDVMLEDGGKKKIPVSLMMFSSY